MKMKTKVLFAFVILAVAFFMNGCATIETLFGPVATPTATHFIASSTPTPSSLEVEYTPTPQNFRHAIVKAPLNMRRCENYKCTIVTTIPNGTTILVGECAVLDDFSSWCEAYYNNDVGFVNADYLRPTQSR